MKLDSARVNKQNIAWGIKTTTCMQLRDLRTGADTIRIGHGIRPIGRYKAGFSLIELMIVIAIVGILAALAIPVYQTYVTRAQVSEGLTLAQPLRHAVVEYYSVNGRLPVVSGNAWTGVLAELGIQNSSDSGAASGRYVRRIWWNNNADHPSVRIRYGGGALDGKLLFLYADFSGGSVTWNCKAPSSDGVPGRFLPANCR